MIRTATFISVLAALTTTSVSAAEPDPHGAHHPASAAQASVAATPAAPPAAPLMMGGGMMEMGGMHGLGLTANRLAALKADLVLAPAQLPLWNAFAEAALAMSNGMAMHPMMGTGMSGSKDRPMAPGAGMQKGMPMPQSGMSMMDHEGSLPERIERHEAMMAKHLEALRKVKVALSSLYAALTPVQRSKIDAAPSGMSPK